MPPKKALTKKHSLELSPPSSKKKTRISTRRSDTDTAEAPPSSNRSTRTRAIPSRKPSEYFSNSLSLFGLTSSPCSESPVAIVNKKTRMPTKKPAAQSAKIPVPATADSDNGRESSSSPEPMPSSRSALARQTANTLEVGTDSESMSSDEDPVLKPRIVEKSRSKSSVTTKDPRLSAMHSKPEKRSAKGPIELEPTDLSNVDIIDTIHYGDRSYWSGDTVDNIKVALDDDNNVANHPSELYWGPRRGGKDDLSNTICNAKGEPYMFSLTREVTKPYLTKDRKTDAYRELATVNIKTVRPQDSVIAWDLIRQLSSLPEDELPAVTEDIRMSVFADQETGFTNIRDASQGLPLDDDIELDILGQHVVKQHTAVVLCGQLKRYTPAPSKKDAANRARWARNSSRARKGTSDKNRYLAFFELDTVFVLHPV